MSDQLRILKKSSILMENYNFWFGLVLFRLTTFPNGGGCVQPRYIHMMNAGGTQMVETYQHKPGNSKIRVLFCSCFVNFPLHQFYFLVNELLCNYFLPAGSKRDSCCKPLMSQYQPSAVIVPWGKQCMECNAVKCTLIPHRVMYVSFIDCLLYKKRI